MKFQKVWFIDQDEMHQTTPKMYSEIGYLLCSYFDIQSKVKMTYGSLLKNELVQFSFTHSLKR